MIDGCRLNNQEFKSFIKSKLNVGGNIHNFEEDLSITFKKLINEVVNKNNQKVHDDHQIQLLNEEILNNKVDYELAFEKIKEKTFENKELRDQINMLEDKLTFFNLLLEENKNSKKNEERYLHQLKLYDEQVQANQVLQSKIKELTNKFENSNSVLESKKELLSAVVKQYEETTSILMYIYLN